MFIKQIHLETWLFNMLTSGDFSKIKSYTGRYLIVNPLSIRFGEPLVFKDGLELEHLIIMKEFNYLPQPLTEDEIGIKQWHKTKRYYIESLDSNYQDYYNTKLIFTSDDYRLMEGVDEYFGKDNVMKFNHFNAETQRWNRHIHLVMIEYTSGLLPMSIVIRPNKNKATVVIDIPKDGVIKSSRDIYESMYKKNSNSFKL